MDEYDGVLPEPGAWTDKHRMFYQELNRCVEDISSAYNAETFSPQKATRVLCELVRMASSFGQSEAALSKFGTKKEERRTAIALEFAAVKILALLAAPLMPEFALSLWNYLGYEQSIWDGTWEETLHFVPSNRLIETPPPQLLGSVAVAS
jgi:methionyl-tRNA synthetase